MPRWTDVRTRSIEIMEIELLGKDHISANIAILEASIVTIAVI
jgi:hypothetical protein